MSGRQVHGGRKSLVASLPEDARPRCEDYARQIHAMPEEFRKKIIVVGPSGVGKTCMLLRFFEGTWSPDQLATIGIDFFILNCRFFDAAGAMNISVHDTAGQETFRTAIKAFMRGASAVLLCWDMSRPETLEMLPEFYNEVAEYNPPGPDGVNRLKSFVVGCKRDLSHEPRDVLERARTLASAFNHGEVWLTSSKLDATHPSSNVITLFTHIAAVLYEDALREAVAVETTEAEPTDAGAIVDPAVMDKPSPGPKRCCPT